MKKTQIGVIIATWSIVAMTGMNLLSDVEASDVITLEDLETNLDYLFPSDSYLSGLEYHSTWREVERGSLQEADGIEVTYEAILDALPNHDEELPTINAYILPMGSQSEAKAQFETWSESDYFYDNTWIKLNEGADYFSYYTDASIENDLIKERSLEEGSLHLVTYYDNVIVIVNFFRTSGQYVRQNVSAYITYLENYEETLSVMNELVIYVEEALKFYLDSTFSVEGPGDEDYHLSTATDSVLLSEALEVPQNGTLELALYIDDASEIGTVLDTVGDDAPAQGDMKVELDENALISLQFYAPDVGSDCEAEEGWHRLETLDSLSLYQWETLTFRYGYGGELELWRNGIEQASCGVSVPRTEGAVYLGDYPGDEVGASFVGYVKEMAVDFSLDESGNRYDDLAVEMICSDVSRLDPHAEAIEYLRDEGVMTGYSDGSCRPTQEVNRVEILKILLLGFGYTVEENYELPEFDDLEEEAWYLPYLNHALDQGIIQGYEDGTYAPADSLNRVEMLKILTLAYGVNLNDYPITELYPDADIDAWYAPYLQYAKDNELLDADSDGNINPSAVVTRGELAETVYRLLKGSL